MAAPLSDTTGGVRGVDAPGVINSTTGTSLISPRSPTSIRRKHSSVGESPVSGAGTSPGAVSDTTSVAIPRKIRKVSRACDFCKTKKLKCSGTHPCEVCIKRELVCVYDAAYRRGRPPTPPPSSAQTQADGGSEAGHPAVAAHTGNSRISQPSGTSAFQSQTVVNREHSQPVNGTTDGQRSVSRGSPELDSAEIEGQYFDLTSNLTFLHRAWKRLAAQRGTSGAVPQVASGHARHQSVLSAGDKPFTVLPGDENPIVDRSTAVETLGFYFDSCVTTYRCLHQSYVASWFNIVVGNMEAGMPLHYDIAHAKASIVMTILAIVSLRKGNIANRTNEPVDDRFLALNRGDAFFCASSRLLDAEVGYPTLESVQARLLQVLYLLQSTRMNQAWFVFGSTLPIVSALGLHRRRRAGSSKAAPNVDYIIAQCRKRTFWVAYTIDKYLAVVLGRPGFYHDDDIDQDFPDCVNDEDMTARGRSTHEPAMECHVDSLIFHAKVARLINQTSREVYSIKKIPHHERLASAQKLSRELHEWREALPYHLGSMRPMSLIPSFRRQAIALKLAYCHAVMHANRPFLLGTTVRQADSPLQDCIKECINAARVALETVDTISTALDLFHAYWWTPYVTFCALAIVYVWEIQQHRANANGSGNGQGLDDLLELAERCQIHLAQSNTPDSPSRRYGIILEELRQEAKSRSAGSFDARRIAPVESNLAWSLETAPPAGIINAELATLETSGTDDGLDGSSYGLNILDNWQATDWLDLDSSAFGPFPEYDVTGNLMWVDQPAGPNCGPLTGTGV